METKSLGKLLKFQKTIQAIKKDGNNPHFKSKYATLPQILSEVKPILSDLGLILLQPIKGNQVQTIIIDSESGEHYDSSMDMPTGLTPQQSGSAITYYRRYLLAGLLSLEIEDDEDDDGHEASKAIPVATKPLYLNKGTEAFEKAVMSLQSGKVTMEQIEKKYTIAAPVKSELINLSKIAS